MLRFRAVLPLALLATTACGAIFIPARPSEPLAASAPGVSVEVTKLWLTDEVREVGLDDGIDLVVELRVANAGAAPIRLSPGALSCVMALDPRRPGETRALLAGGGGEGAFPGEPPGEGSLLAVVTIPPRETREVWALFHGYRFTDSDVPRRITLAIPVEGRRPLELVVADPARGGLRWAAPPASSAVAVGFKNVSLLAEGMGGQAPSTEITRVERRGPILWDIGLLSTVFVQTKGHRLVSETSAFTGLGFTGHLTLPVATWGSLREPRQIGVFAGGAASLLIELPRPRAADDMRPIHTYGLLQAEGGIEVDIGAARFAPTPFPLSPDARGVPRWSVRLAYVQSWAGTATTGGYATTLRFTW
jgi:hypothetical protein